MHSNVDIQHMNQKPHFVPQNNTKPEICKFTESEEDVCANLPLEGENLSYVRLKFSQIRRRAFIDTGSCANAMPQNLFDEILQNHPELL